MWQAHDDIDLRQVDSIVINVILTRRSYTIDDYAHQNLISWYIHSSKMNSL